MTQCNINTTTETDDVRFADAGQRFGMGDGENGLSPALIAAGAVALPVFVS